MIIMEGSMVAVRQTRELTSDLQVGSRDSETRPVVQALEVTKHTLSDTPPLPRPYLLQQGPTS